MTLWLVTRILYVVCCVIVSYAFPSTDGNVGAPYSKNFDDLEVSVDQETLATRDHEAVSSAINDFHEIDALTETRELDNETIIRMDMSVYDVNDKIGNSSRKKRSLPDPCRNAKMDAITITMSGSRYAFQGSYYWKLVGTEVDEAYPRRISTDWDGLVGNLDAAFTLPSGETFFFKMFANSWLSRKQVPAFARAADGQENYAKSRNVYKNRYHRAPLPRDISKFKEDLLAKAINMHKKFGSIKTKCWLFINKKMDVDFPKPIHDVFEGIPNRLDAAFVWGKNNKTYFFKGNKYWRYDMGFDPPVISSYPKPVSLWSDLISDGIDAAVQWDKGKTYFFKGQEYYRYDDEEFDVLNYCPPYPRLTSKYWFGCE